RSRTGRFATCCASGSASATTSRSCGSESPFGAASKRSSRTGRQSSIHIWGDHPSWRLRELAAREYPHLTSELALEPLSGNAQRELLLALVGEETLPQELESRLLEQAEGNPFYLEELVRSLADTGAPAHENGGWRFDHAAEIEIPPTVEKVLLARID